VRAFIAQRLVRVLCANCKRPAEHSESYLKQVGFPLESAHTALAAGVCEHCRHTGFEGRAAIYEICLVSQRLQDLIIQGRPASALRAAAMEEGMLPLRLYGWNKVIKGMTTVEEVVRVTTSDLDLLDE
jgi:type II secretory ATPase GspE/PulE/Tfp pilus assembly ATPase PilB-like protein